jgi:putative ATP-binding cassette transporter
MRHATIYALMAIIALLLENTQAFFIAGNGKQRFLCPPTAPRQQKPRSYTAAAATRTNESNDDHKDLNKNRNLSNQFKLFQEMAFPYYQHSVQGRWLLAGLLALTLLNAGVSVAFSYLGKDFWNALSDKDAAEFYSVLQKYVAALLVGAPTAALYSYQRQQLAVHWREWMTARTFALYATNQVYYKLSDDIDNPDQRITQDVQSFTSYSLTLLISVLTSCIDLCSFSTILWTIYPTLFYAILVYAAFGTAVTAFLGKNLVGLNFDRLSKEADLRYALVRLRDNAESIAFYAGEDLEGQAVEDRLEKVISNKRKINVMERNLEYFTTAYRYLVQILPVAVVAPRFFAGQIQLGVISQSAGAFNHILNDLSIIVNQFESLSSFSAGIDRLSTFYEAMRDADVKRDFNSSLLFNSVSDDAVNATRALQMSSTTIQMKFWDPTTKDATFNKDRHILSIDDLKLSTPDRKRTLIHNLSFSLKEGQNLLIAGNSGAGKSSLLRAIAGLWTSGDGTIVRPVNNEVYFLPQRPYCTIGTLKDQLLYPSLDPMDLLVEHDQLENDGNKIVPRTHWLEDSPSNDELLDILAKVNMLDVAVRAGDGDPIKGLRVELDWTNTLSLGEQQRLAFGRLLVNRPRLVILDEATSALDMAAEARMYGLLQTMTCKATTTNGQQLSEPLGLTYISVGHRPSLLKFHDKRLRLSGDAGFELSDIEQLTNANLIDDIAIL